MNLTGRDYREILKNELIERKRNNPSYSLRSFARSLKISPTTLSCVLKGKRGLEATRTVLSWVGFLNAPCFGVPDGFVELMAEANVLKPVVEDPLS